ncbi:hypothetical protein C0J52_06370 [Blattella germanica]|nr:hypothetical protein C0J52_06370 [Blattella germanica]
MYVETTSPGSPVNDADCNLAVLPVGDGEVVGVSSSLLTAVKLATPENCCSGPAGPTKLLALESPRGKTRDAETITDVCSGGELPEVEIISLLEEQIPRYRLRADTLTQFTGEN